MADNKVCKSTKKPDYIAWRTFENEQLAKASYVMNSKSGVLQIFRPVGSGTVSYSTFFEGHGGTDSEPPGKRKNIRSLSRLERDLLRLPEEDFKKKYPNVELFETRVKTRRVGERIIEETD